MNYTEELQQSARRGWGEVHSLREQLAAHQAALAVAKEALEAYAKKRGLGLTAQIAIDKIEEVLK